MIERNERVSGLACFVLPVDRGRLLLAKHTYGYPDYWAMVGGLAEPGEDLAAAARREAQEETGLDVAVGTLIAIVDRLDLLIAVFAGRVVGGVEHRQVNEIAELRWFDAHELESPDVFDLVQTIGPSILDIDIDIDIDLGLRHNSVEWPDGSARSGWAISPR